ncbi:MAG: 8-amino-7-oxononanoate synthase [Chitinophagaceae bacterium]|nr:8-amino-7-oxononanoate synthase [Chitinophagaceae bacterium]
MKEEFLHKKLQERKEQNALRQLKLPDGKIDFCSNDYLGIVTNRLLEQHQNAASLQTCRHGSTGSRLLAGNYLLVEQTEKLIAEFHDAEAALIFNAGYDANTGLLSSVPQKGDTILYDYLSHASIRDGIRLSFAQAFSFEHNDLDGLAKKIKQATGNIFVVTESVFSMDGDTAPLQQIADLCTSYGAQLIVDEAHATGLLGSSGEGLVQHLGLQGECFARIHTFGKALGCHGAVVLGSDALRQYLINFCRPFIYSTALPETSVMAIRVSYELFPTLQKQRDHLQSLAAQFQLFPIPFQKLESETAIQGVIIPGNEAVKKMADRMQKNGFDVRPILYPTVPKGSERLRIVLHSFNTENQVQQLVETLSGD